MFKTSWILSFFLLITVHQNYLIALLEVFSPSFKNEGLIPIAHTDPKKNISPEITWSPGPAETQSYAIVCHDADASNPNTATHWIIFNIHFSQLSVNSGLENNADLYDGIKQGMNDFSSIGWKNPTPTSKIHHYVFTVYALNTFFNLQSPTALEFLKIIQNHILDKGTLIGTCKKKAKK